MPQYNLGTARGRVDVDTSGLKEADISLREAGRGLLFTGTALVGAFGYVVKTAADFEKQMDFVGAITEATGEEMDQLKEIAIELGKRGPYGPREVAEAFVELAKAGVETKDIVDGVGEAAVNLAAAADIGLVESTEVLVNTLKTFNLEAAESVDVVDTIAGAANASTIDVDDFAYSLRYAGSVAAAVGIPLDEVATALAILGDRGIKGSTGGTSMRRVLLNLTPASEKAKDAMTELGIIMEDGTNQFFTAEGKAKSLSEVFQILGDVTKDLTDSQRLDAMNTIFGARAAPSALILAAQGAQGFEDYMAAIERTSAADVAAQRLDNLAGAVTKLKAAIEATFIETGTPFQKTLQTWAEYAREAVLWFGRLPEGVQKFIVGGVLAVGILSLLAGGFLLTVGNIVRTIRIIGQLTSLLGGLGGALRGTATAVTILGRALVFLFANPIGLVILAIAALIAAFIYFYQTSETFRNFINSIPEKIVGAWNAVVDFFTGPFTSAITGAFDTVTGAIDTFFSGISLTKPIESATRVWTAFWDSGFGGEGITTKGSKLIGMLERAGVAFHNLYENIKDFIGGNLAKLSNVGQFFEEIGEGIGSGLSTGFDKVVEFAGNLPGILSGAASTAVDGFLTFFTNLPELLGYALGFTIGRVAKWNIDFYNEVLGLTNKVGELIAQWGPTLVSKFAQLWVDIITGTTQWVGDMGLQALKMGAEFNLNVLQFLLKLPGEIGQILANVLGTILGAIPGLVSAAAQAGLEIFTSWVQFVADMPNKMAELILEVGGSILNNIPTVAGYALEFGDSILHGIIDSVAGLPDLIWTALTGAIDTVRNLVGSAFDAAKSFGSGLWNGFKDGMGISSPSYIERALFAVEGQAFKTAANLDRAIDQINAQARRLPPEVTQAAERQDPFANGINGPATVNTQAERLGNQNGEGGCGVVVNIHIGTLAAGVDAGDALGLSRALAAETEKQLSAVNGKKLVSRGPQISVPTN